MIKEELSVDIQTIDAALLSKMFLAGAKNLEAKKEWRTHNKCILSDESQ